MKKRILQDKKLTTAAQFFQKFQNAELLKYAPEKRGLFRVEIERADYFVKLYPKKFQRDNRGAKIHFAGQEFWELSQKGKLNFRVPVPVFWDSETRTLWQKKLEGDPAIEFLKNGNSKEITFQIGQAIAAIADSAIVSARLFDCDEQIKDSSDFAEETAAKFPQLRDEIEKLLNFLAESHRFQKTQIFVPAHGDMHIDQWLFDGKTLGLLDFEDFSYAEIERDLAFFIVQIKAEYGEEICAENVEKDFLAGFESSGKKINETLLNIYKAHKWLAKAAKVSDEKSAKKMIEKAWRFLR